MMVCATVLKPRQTAEQRLAEVAKRMRQLDGMIASGRLKMSVRGGKPVFQGIPESERDGISDACIFHTLSNTGSAAARIALARAEQLQGKVSRHGVHTHDGITFNAH
jgi:hypothetical protein